ncbi:hypothetical protein HYH02_000435 [Chlamydomonas schloesseri]|uniref:Protein kinase domain-containing protein n=1 Tax=Chlamydomonas schloesseri TaxID=2026947 RepID=A0A835WW92_9CHLO|nr:hypothetical protein HYH02_000435 [Chlamydomonas schloesseri]|eukprot:KAG2454594.1 hypothetical protein HYH02_000435 [Chlamydomonas schloesseri]
MGNVCFGAKEEPGTQGERPQPATLPTLSSISLPNGESMLSGPVGNSSSAPEPQPPGSGNEVPVGAGLSVKEAHLEDAARLQQKWALEAAMSMSPAELSADVQLLESIGSGSSAVVYRGIFQGGDVALKIMITNSRNEKAGIREALLSPHLRHPARCVNPSEDGLGNPRLVRHERQGWRDVLTRVGAIPNKHLLMLVQELCDAGSLGGAIRQGMFRPKPGVRTEALARRVLLRTATELCRGMVHIHTANVLHGDLKPANVLLARSRKDRRGFTVKVADFGLSKLLHVNGGSQVDSSAGGTLAYMSPEAFNGVFSRASDVYAFGMLLHEMVTGERPYEHMIPAQVMMGVSFGGLRPDWPVAHWPEICALGARCLAQEPAERPSFRQLAEELVALEEALRATSKQQLSQSQVDLPDAGPPASNGRAAAHMSSSCSDGKALRGTSSLTPQTPMGVHSAPGLPSGGALSDRLSGGSSAPSTAAAAAAAAASAPSCAISGPNCVLATIPEPLESATFSTTAALQAVSDPTCAVASLAPGGAAAVADTVAAAAAAGAKAAAAAAMSVATPASAVGVVNATELVGAAAVDAAAHDATPSSTNTDAESDLQEQPQGQQLQPEWRRVELEAEVQPGEVSPMRTADLADVSLWDAPTALSAADVHLQCVASPRTPPD